MGQINYKYTLISGSACTSSIINLMSINVGGTIYDYTTSTSGVINYTGSQPITASVFKKSSCSLTGSLLVKETSGSTLYNGSCVLKTCSVLYSFLGTSSGSYNITGSIY
jgi:hypothetical protein